MRVGIQVTGAVGGSLRRDRGSGQGKEAGVMEETDLICSTQVASGYVCCPSPEQERACLTSGGH